MTSRHSLLLGTALVSVAGFAHAQQRSRDDLLDTMTRHVQICAEITDTQQRLACYDRMQTQVGDVQAPARTPTPLPSSPPLAPAAPPVAAPPVAGPAPIASPPPVYSGGSQIDAAPLTPPPLTVPGGGVATLPSQGGPAPGAPTPLGAPTAYGSQPAYGSPTPLAPPSADVDRAFNPRDSSAGYRPPDMAAPRPQPQVRRTGPRPVPNYGSSMPVVTLAASNLTYGDSRYWQVTVTVTSNVARSVDTQIQCSFLNGGSSVGEAYFGPILLAAGEQVSTDLVGPPTTAFVDSTNCRVMRQ